MNTDSAVNVLWAETDNPGLRERLAELTLGGVKVAWATYSDNGGGHAAFILDTPVVTGIRTPEEDRAMLRKLSLTHSYFVTAIDGDRHAGLRGMTKNPLSSRWTTEVGNLTPRSLDETLVPLQAMAQAESWQASARRYKGDRKRELSPEGRNCALFDLTKWWAGFCPKSAQPCNTVLTTRSRCLNRPTSEDHVGPGQAVTIWASFAMPVGCRVPRSAITWPIPSLGIVRNRSRPSVMKERRKNIKSWAK